jgi:hypothetical protein
MDRPPADDTARIVRFMLMKAAIFIGIPLVAAVVAVWLSLR